MIALRFLDYNLFILPYVLVLFFSKTFISAALAAFHVLTPIAPFHG
jgi:hypothetical protein